MCRDPKRIVELFTAQAWPWSVDKSRGLLSPERSVEELVSMFRSHDIVDSSYDT